MGIITNDVGNVPTLGDYAINLSTAEALAGFIESSFTESMDQQYEKIALNLGDPDTPLARTPVAATDDGPTPAYDVACDEAIERLKHQLQRKTTPQAANDNNAGS